MKRRVIPIDMGGSPHQCVLSPPRGAPPDAELVQAHIESALARWNPGEDTEIEVGFFRGGIPSADLLDAARPHGLRVACSPADLDADTIRKLVDAEVGTVELEVLSFRDRTLRKCERGYRARNCVALMESLMAFGVRVGVVLSPGLPGTDFASSMEDAVRVVQGPGGRGAPRACFARVHPLLAFKGSRLAQWHEDGWWAPMTLPDAVDVTRQMADTLEEGGVEVIRIGLQPGHDLPHRVVAGPVHPNLRALVEQRRFRDRMAAVLEGVPKGRPVQLRVNPKDLSWAKGTENENVRVLRVAHGLSDLSLTCDEAVERGGVEFA